MEGEDEEEESSEARSKSKKSKVISEEDLAALVPKLEELEKKKLKRKGGKPRSATGKEKAKKGILVCFWFSKP